MIKGLPVRPLFTFGGVDLSQYVVAEQVERQLINIETSWGGVFDRPERLLKRNAKGKEIKVQVRFLTESFQELADDIHNFNMALLKPKQNELASLKLWDRPSTYDMVVPDGSISFERVSKTGKADVTFKSPYAYSLSNTQTTYRGTDSMVIKGYGGVQPIITGTFLAGSKPRFTDVTNGKVLMLDYTLPADDTIIIDCANRTIKASKITNPHRYLTYESRFFEFDTGPFKITSPDAKEIIVQYNERWLV